MNHWIVIFSDKPEMLPIRRERFSQHLAYLEGNHDMFVDGAPLSDDENQHPIGGLWILKSDSKERVLALIENDPMYEPALRGFQIYATGKKLDTNRV